MPVVNFYHVDATMKGTDYHDFECILPPPSGVTLSDYPYDVMCKEKDGDKIVKTVTSDGKRMIQKNNDVTGVMTFHSAQFGPPPHPLKQLKTQIKIIQKASSKATMSVASVSGEKISLACCLDAAKGRNKNCTDRAVPTNNVKCVSTVKTRPTKQDYLSAFEGEYFEDHDIPRFIRDAPGPEPVRSKPTADRMKKYIDQAKHEVEQLKNFGKLLPEP